jgi:hypothetical protein
MLENISAWITASTKPAGSSALLPRLLAHHGASRVRLGIGLEF